MLAYKMPLKNNKDNYRATIEDLSAPNPCNDTYFRSLLEQPDKHGQVLHYLAPDLAALVSSIRAFDNLSSLIISDTRYVLNSSRQRHTFPALKRDHNNTSDLYAREITYRHVDKDVRGQDAVLIDPLTWPDNKEAWPQKFGQSHYRGFSVLAQAASMGKTNACSLTLGRYLNANWACFQSRWHLSKHLASSATASSAACIAASSPSTPGRHQHLDSFTTRKELSRA